MVGPFRLFHQQQEVLVNLPELRTLVARPYALNEDVSRPGQPAPVAQIQRLHRMQDEIVVHPVIVSLRRDERRRNLRVGKAV